MELGARLFPLHSFNKLHTRDVQSRAVWEFEKHCVTQIVFGVAEYSQLLAAFYRENIILQVFHP